VQLFGGWTFNHRRVLEQDSLAPKGCFEVYLRTVAAKPPARKSTSNTKLDACCFRPPLGSFLLGVVASCGNSMLLIQ
jgi:hypothetical protein